MRRQLDFGDAGAGAGPDPDPGGDLEDDDDFLIRAVDYIEAKRRAPPCVCGRGDCAVERDEQHDQWMYVCSSQPKCKHVSLCKEVDLSPQSPPVIRSDPKLANHFILNIPSTHVADAVTPINNVNLRGADGALINVSPHAAVATTPIHVSPQGVGGTEALKVSLRRAKSNDEWPICRCTAGKCKLLRVGNEDYYVCPIPKGQGACSYKVPLLNAAKEPPDNNANGLANRAQPNDDEWPFDIIDDEIVPTAQATPHAEVHQESPSMPCQPISMAKTPTKSPMTHCGTRSPMTPRPNSTCYRCGEKGHWVPDCPKPKPSPGACFKCGMVGHYWANCPQLSGSRK